MKSVVDRSFTLGRTTILGGALYFFAPLSIAYAMPDTASAIEGPAIVIDGDTLEVAGLRLRLEGIDAPEAAQTCKRASGDDWPCGMEASEALSALVRNRQVACDPVGQDKYKRTLAICFVDGDELNGLMVATGYARAFVKYSTAYAADEASAKAASAGIWQGTSEAPWDFRHPVSSAGTPAAASLASAAGCPIKGNISKHGHIYHLPSMPWYGNVKIDLARGERWFCSEAEAAAAGWRPAMAN